MNWLQNFIARLFRIEPARDRVITIREAHTFRENVIQNKLWYQGDGVTLEQYFKKTAKWDVEKARFWAATAQGNVRKIHSGIVGTVVDRYKDIVLADLDAVDFGENMDILEERWNEIFEGSKLNDVIGDAIVGALSSGDGAFKITADECSPYPIVEFYDAEGRGICIYPFDPAGNQVLHNIQKQEQRLQAAGNLWIWLYKIQALR